MPDVYSIITELDPAVVDQLATPTWTSCGCIASCPTLIIRCTDSGAPDVLDKEPDALVAANSSVRLLRPPLTHLAPAWDALDDVIVEIQRFLDTSPT